MFHGPILDQATDWAGAQKRGGFDGAANFFGNFDDGLNVVLQGARGAVGADFHAGGDDFACEGFGVGVGARAGAGQADIYRVNSERFHQVQNFDCLGDAGVADGGILQAVAQSFVIQGDVARGGDFGAGVGVPVVDEFVFHFVSRLQALNSRGRWRSARLVLNSEWCSCAGPLYGRVCRLFGKIRSDRFRFFFRRGLRFLLDSRTSVLDGRSIACLWRLFRRRRASWVSSA